MGCLFSYYELRDLIKKPKMKGRILNLVDAPHSILSVQNMLAAGGSTKVNVNGNPTEYTTNHIVGFATRMSGIWPKAMQKLAERDDIFTDEQCRNLLREFQMNTSPPNAIEVGRAIKESGEAGKQLSNLWTDDTRKGVGFPNFPPTFMKTHLKGAKPDDKKLYEIFDLDFVSGPLSRFRDKASGWGWRDLLALGSLKRDSQDFLKALEKGKAEEKGGVFGKVDRAIFGPNDNGEFFNGPMTDGAYKQTNALLEFSLLGSASVGAVYMFPIFPQRDRSFDESKCVKVAIDSRWAAMEVDFKIAALVMEQKSVLRKYMPADFDFGKLGPLLRTVKQLEDSIKQEFDLTAEATFMKLASESQWQHFLDGWKSSAKTFLTTTVRGLMPDTTKGGKGFEKMIIPCLQKYTEGLVQNAEIKVPGIHAEYCGSKVLTMDMCTGSSVKHIVAAVMSMERCDWNTLSVRHFLHIQKACVALHMILQVIGWMLLRSEAKVIHGDPHLGNFLHQFLGTCTVDDVECVGFEAEANVLTQLMQDVDYGRLVGSVQVSRNTLSIMDWGNSISEASLENAKMFSGNSRMNRLRECIRSMMTGLARGDDSELHEAMKGLGLDATLTSLIKFLLLGGEKDNDAQSNEVDLESTPKRRRVVNQSNERNLKATLRKLHETDLSGLNSEIAKLLNVLLFAGGLATQMNAFIQKCVSDAAKKECTISVVALWRHWL